MLIIDPISAYLEEGRKFSYDPMGSISIIKKLSRIAERTGCAIILVTDSSGEISYHAKNWQFSYESGIVSFLYLEADDGYEYDERILYHEHSLIGLEGVPVEYRLTPNRGMQINI